jgi:parallel beta-helix repeat protein
MVIAATAAPTVRNNIIAFNPGGGIPAFLTSADFNCVYTNDSTNNPGPNGFIADPLFICPEARDYHLAAGSPCIDAGDPNPANNDPDGSRNDIGALPFQYVRPWAINVHAGSSPDGPVTADAPSIYWSTRTVASIQKAFEIEIGSDSDWVAAEIWQPGPTLSQDTSIMYAGRPLQDRITYYIRVRVSDATAWGQWSSTAAFVTRFKSTIHVPVDYPTIQAAIDAAIDRDTVWVAPGTYTESIAFKGKKIVVKSEQGPLNTVITNLDTSDLVVIGPGGDSLSALDGFSLIGGRIGIWCQNAGPTIVHNILVGQRIGNWAALSLGGNTLGSTGNSPARIINNTIVGSANGGICISSSKQPVVRNNIVVGNSRYGVAVGNVPAVTIGFNNVWGSLLNLQGDVILGTGSLSVDPLLEPDYRLQVASPCFNAGDPDPLFNDPDHTRNDMGAVYYSCCNGPSRGDINNDGRIDLSDLSLLVMHLTGLGATLSCPVAADVSGGSQIDLTDLSALVNFFSGSGLHLPSCL